MFASSIRNYSWGQIRSDNNLCLEASDKKLIFKACNINNKKQLWTHTYKNNFHFQNDDGEISDHCIDIPTESNARNNTELQLYRCGASGSSQWIFELNPGTTTLVARSIWTSATSKCLARAKNNSAIITYCKNTKIDLDFDVFPQAAIAYYNVNKEHWMEEVFSDYSNTSLASVLIPGTHNSGTYDKGFYKISKTQNLGIYDQLAGGSRYFDVRVDNRGFEGLVICHGSDYGSKDSFTNFLLELNRFAYWHSREIIFLDLHEVPELVDQNDTKGIQNYRELASIIDKIIGKRLIKPIFNLKNVTFQNLWDDQTKNSHTRNIILLTKEYHNFKLAKVGNLCAYLWDRPSYLEEKWPQSTDFNTIYDKISYHLQRRSASIYTFSVAQLLRTPSTSYGIGTFMGLNEGPFELATERTKDGFFNLSISKWVNDWINICKYKPNIIIADFINYTSLIDEAIWLNLKRKYETMNNIVDIKR